MVIIYIIRSKQTDDVYYGSTTQILSTRLSGHRADYKKYLNNTMHYITSFEVIKYEDATIEIVEEVDDANRKEREGFYIRNCPCVNKTIPDRIKKDTDKNYRETHQEQIKEYAKKYDESHKEEKHKYRDEHKEDKRKYDIKHRTDNKEAIKQQRKQFYDKNKAEILEKQKQKRDENKDEINAKRRQKRLENKK